MKLSVRHPRLDQRLDPPDREAAATIRDDGQPRLEEIWLGTGPAADTAEIALMYELLDAHDDTARLASELAAHDRLWAAHLDYLRGLQRTGREILAQISNDGSATSSATATVRRSGGLVQPGRRAVLIRASLKLAIV